MLSGVNDFSLKVATVNGTGSASANGLLMQAIFRMGVPVSGKNVFPSNIQGLPTWYEIRVNSEGHLSRTPLCHVVVAMNPETYQRDIDDVLPGGWVLHDSSWPMASALQRQDVNFLGVPFAKMCVDNFKGARLRILMKNIAYAGALAALLDIDLDVIKGLLQETFGAKKAHLLEANYRAIHLGYDYATEHFDAPLPVHLEHMDENADAIVIDGNSAAALGCIYAGATVTAWYPITPSTSLIDAFTAFSEQMRVEEGTGRRKVAIIQAEDELAAAGIVLGAGWAGARSFTATSGAGISLMMEFLGLGYYAEVPGVVFDVQRVGPSTGMPTRTQQGDILTCAFASHGDTKHICLYPADPAECFDFAVRAFDLAERYQTIVFVLSDLDIGMNDWVVPRFKWDDEYRPDRGKVLGPEELEEMEVFYRYLDVDGDGIPYRTIPGEHPTGAYFTRGSGHTRHGHYTEDPDEYQDVLDRIARKVEGVKDAVPEPRISCRPGARNAIVSIGACDGAVKEAIAILEKQGVYLDYMRVRGFPFSQKVEDFLNAHDLNVVIEQNRDGQLRSLLSLETSVPRKRLESGLSYGGLPLSADFVVERVTELLGQDLPAAERGVV